jgi:hypothetical protein
MPTHFRVLSQSQWRVETPVIVLLSLTLSPLFKSDGEPGSLRLKEDTGGTLLMNRLLHVN